MTPAVQPHTFESYISLEVLVATTFTPDNLRKTYGGRLTLLDAAGAAVRGAQRRG